MDNFLAVEAPLIERLQDNLTGIEAFGSLMEFSAIPRQSLVFPSIYVGFGGYAPEGDPIMLGALQQIRQSWVVLVAVRNVQDRDGSLLRQDAGPILWKILQLLLGWRPMIGVQPFTLSDPMEPMYGGGCGFFPMSFACKIACRGEVVIK